MKTSTFEHAGLVTTLTMLSLLAFASGSYAQEGPRRAPPVDGPVIISERMADRLGLDDAQRESIKGILEAARPQFDALRESVELQIAAVLTAEQQAELEAMKERGRRFAADRPRGKRHQQEQTETQE